MNSPSTSSVYKALKCDIRKIIVTALKLAYQKNVGKSLENIWCWTAFNSTSNLHALRLFKNRCAELPTLPGVPCFNPSTRRCSLEMKDGCVSLFAAKFLLSSLGIATESKPLDYRAACWLPELQSTALLYHTPGRWEVDDQCISTVQRVLSKIVLFVLDDLLSPRFGVEEGLYLRYLPKALYEAFLENSDDLLQRAVYPAFKRLRHMAALRRNVQSPVAIVSCTGLRGTRDEAIEATERLLRLLFVNETQYVENSNGFSYLCALFLNHILPCAVRQAI